MHTLKEKFFIKINTAIWALSYFSAFIITAALIVLAARAAMRLELRWDTFWYHLPFDALRGGIDLPFEMNEKMQNRYQGFPMLPHLLQGFLWRLTGTVNATGVVNYLTFILFLTYCHFVLRAKYWLVALISLTTPLILIHTATTYVDLVGNSFLAIALSSGLYLYLFPKNSSRIVFICGLAGLIAAAWSKYQLAPIVGLIWCFYVFLCLFLSPTGFNKRHTVLLLLLAALIVAVPYIKNLFLYGNPFWPIRLPFFLPSLFPFTEDSQYLLTERPPPLKDYAQFKLFFHSLFEINHPLQYDHRPRWIIDQGNAWIAFRMGGFWAKGVIFFLLTSITMLIVCHKKKGAIASMLLLGLLCFIALLPQSHELRYYMFIPLFWAAAIGMIFPKLQEKSPLTALTILSVSTLLFGYMCFENRVHYHIEKINYMDAAQKWGAAQWWPRLIQGQTYCAADMMPISIMLTGPTMKEFSIIDRSSEELCPEGSIVLTKNGNLYRKGDTHRATGENEKPGAQNAQDYVNKSLILYRSGKYNESINVSLKALQLIPDNDVVFNNICAAYNGLGQWSKAIEACEKAIKSNPANQLAINNLTWARQHKTISEGSGKE